ncbi:MAG: hypothetical protein ACJ8IR_07595 [Alphaproteobacteria bacterium]|jgi:hypothetical protein
MNTEYFIRHYNGQGGLLAFELIACNDDGEAIFTAVSEPVPSGCTVLEVSAEKRIVWRGEPTPFGNSASLRLQRSARLP